MRAGLVEPQAVAGLAVQVVEAVASVGRRLPLPASAEAPETRRLQLASPDLQAAGLSVVWTDQPFLSGHSSDMLLER